MQDSLEWDGDVHLLQLLKEVEGVDSQDEHLSELAGYAKGVLDRGGKLSDSREWRKAQADHQCAVDIFRKLHTKSPAVYRADLALSLNALAFDLNNLKRHSDAETTTNEALEHYRALHAAKPDVYGAGLSRSLYNRSVHLGNVKRHSDARGAILEAIEHCRALYAVEPKIHCADLARYLTSHALSLDRMQRPSAALEIIREAVGHYKTLCAEDPGVYSSDLAWSLGVRAACLNALKRHSDAQTTAVEAVRQCRKLYTANKAVYRVDLAISLHNLAIYLDNLKRHSDARDTVNEAIEHFRVLFDAEPEVYRVELARSLHSLAIYLENLQLQPEARDIALKAREHYEILYNVEPNIYRVDLACSLHNLAIYTDRPEYHYDALDIVRKAIKHRQILFAAEPDIYRADLACSLYNMAIYLNSLDYHSDARYAVRKAIEHRRILFAADPDTYRADLTISLINYSQYLNKLELCSEASSAEREALLLLDRTKDVVPPSNPYIGSGSFGTVYTVKWSSSAAAIWWHHLNYEQLVVKMLNGVSAKMIDLSPASGSSNKQLFRELTVSFRLGENSHPNVVPYLGYITHNDRIGLLLPFFSGGNVLEYIEKTPGADRRKLCREIALGIRHLHGMKEPIAHGDLKPQNVVIDADGHAALCDFGLSHIQLAVNQDVEDPTSILSDTKASRQNTRHTGLTASEFNGTLHYCAPELLGSDNAHPTCPADVYAFASTCAYILSGTPPFSQFPDVRVQANIIDALTAGNVLPYTLDSIIRNYPGFDILEQCWSPYPLKRPTIRQICEQMGW